ncbi:hypothetical protein FSP39_012481 [Pinctada imbricata]|uniref:Coilin N-terminal domain-containing protein n=1 Tax=Pinctada imbricata TaxID=66713 RepID=A0AA88XRW4_PINIB|nr:hypothetical protein FSP39_012481 [Pinctada imbricata]
MAAPINFHVRVKIFFENFAVQPTWLLLDQKDTRTIKKLCKIIYKNFIGEKTHLELYLENCRIPQWESTRILHDNDIIFVRALEKRTQNERLMH